MIHLQARPSSECLGQLLYLEHWLERVFDEAASEWIEVVRTQYQCEGCGDYLSLDRRWVEVEIDGTNVLMLEVKFVPS